MASIRWLGLLISISSVYGNVNQSSISAIFKLETSSKIPIMMTATTEQPDEEFTPSLVFAADEKDEKTASVVIKLFRETTADDSATTENAVVHHYQVPTKLEEKLESLLCDVPGLPSESVLWNGNQTRDLFLPLVVRSECSADDDTECPKEPSLSWDASADVQSGDVLLIHVDDHVLIQGERVDNLTRNHQQAAVVVYQVNRMGYDHCDVSEGGQLDITPLIIDGRKIFTLYDKDLTEGINLMIVVSELWGRHCIRLRVSVKSDNCGENADCSGKGICFSNMSMEGFECQCCSGYIGAHCEEKDACYPSPCSNNGICVDLSQGHEGSTFQCLCPYGFTGKRCEKMSDPCESSPCGHGGTCHWNETSYYCQCADGYSGPNCRHADDPCRESPCKYGLCVSQGDSYACFCKPGYAGENCEYEYNECQSSPCHNGGTCMDAVNGYQCICGRGYNGKHCQVKVDLCDPNPCPEGTFCEDRGNNFSCECPKGYTGPQCSQPLKAMCSSSPCHNGGTCWSSAASFYCACPPGFQGETCNQLIPINEPKPTNEDPTNLSSRFDRMHNVYIAAGVLACALLLVILTVAVCHCGVHETYENWFIKATPLLPCKIRKFEAIPRKWSGREFLEQEKEALTPKMPVYPNLDGTDVYYTVDFTDTQHTPLIS